MKSTYCLSLLALVLGSLAHESSAIEVQNFRAGLVCEARLDIEGSDVGLPVGWICFETEAIYMTGQGRCVYDRQEKHCSWYGFEFDYKGATEGDEIQCRSTSTLPTDIGNPSAEKAEDTTTYEYSLVLPAGDGHFYNPQYSVFSPGGVELADTDETVCSFEGKELFRFRFTIIYPSLTEKAVDDSIERIRRAIEEREQE